MSARDSDTEDEEAERFQLPAHFRLPQALVLKTPVVLLHQRTRTRLEKCIKRKAARIFLNTPPSSPSSSPPSSPPSSPRRRRPKRRNHRAQHRRSVNASRVAAKAAVQAASTANTHAFKALRVSRKANHRHMKSPAGPSEKFLREVINDGRRHRRPTHTKKPLPRWGAATNDTARMRRLRQLVYAAKVQEQHQEDKRHRPRKGNK